MRTQLPSRLSLILKGDFPGSDELPGFFMSDDETGYEGLASHRRFREVASSLILKRTVAVAANSVRDRFAAKDST